MKHVKLASHGTSQTGVVLVFVLIMTTLLSVMAAGFSYSMRGNAAQVHTIKSNLKKEALLDAGLTYAQYKLSEPDVTLRWVGDSKQHTFKFKGEDIYLIAQDESGKFDLNFMDKPLLLSLFSSLPETQQSAQQLSDTIIDYRNMEGIYADDRNSAKTTKRLFKHLGELRNIKGITEAIYDKVSPLLTVVTKQKRADLSVASQAVLEALPSSTSDWVQSLLTPVEPGQNGRIIPSIPLAMKPYASASSSIKGRLYTITASIKNSGRSKIKQRLIRKNQRGGHPPFTEVVTQ